MNAKQKLVLVTVLSATMGLGMWTFYRMQGKINASELFMFAALVLVAVFAVILGIRRFREERRGEPAEDEMSKMISLKAAATSFFISLYFWLALSYIISERDIEVESAIGAGIIGMSLIFAGSWLYHRSKGLD